MLARMEHRGGQVVTLCSGDGGVFCCKTSRIFTEEAVKLGIKLPSFEKCCGGVAVPER